MLAGSPPRMRGKGPWALDPSPGPGITPAYAGKSCCPSPAAVAGRDHPRVCGEKIICQEPPQAVHGSPPRMRGKASAPGLRRWYARITPAYAGKRPAHDSYVGARRDHPRVCGEKSAESVYLFDRAGSPPRMRGKGVKPEFLRRNLRITPAYAGKR